MSWFKKYRIVPCFCILPFLMSCKESNRRYIIALLHEWEGKEISFPTNVAFTIQGRDSADFFKRNKCKVVTYIDSVGCTSCKLRLTAWKEFIHIVDSLRPDSVQFLFFFHPHKGINIHQILRMDGFIYPICIDERDSFNKLNKFPPDLNFQTFLLDKSNKVMAIGNPVHNPKVRDLYINIIQGKGETIEDEGIKTAISIKTTNLSLGVFDWQQEQKAEFILENAGDQPLVIDNVIASCGCVTTSYSKEPVRSNGSVSLSVKYKAERPEHFDKTIKVYCNAKSSPILLKITGDAR